MRPIIKWPGGKSAEISKIERLIPSYDRYIEPFFGGGALYFYLQPRKAVINDISPLLTKFYELVKRQDQTFRKSLNAYCESFQNLQGLCTRRYAEIYEAFLPSGPEREGVGPLIERWKEDLFACFADGLLLDRDEFLKYLTWSVNEKMIRLRRLRNASAFTEEDMAQSLITGFTGGYYTYFRKVYNDLSLGRIPVPSEAYRIANFYFVREYCYGAMFRYNAQGEFNIPYGGKTYNKKDFAAKIDSIFNDQVKALFADTEICNVDFEDLFARVRPSKKDFIFLDPPYDTEFSDYEGNPFTKRDQERLAACLKSTDAQFMLLIQKTPFIEELYGTMYNTVTFETCYSYNVKSRNNRSVEHVLITNLPVG